MSEIVDQLKFEEGLRLTAYLCPAGKRTIGYGRNLDAKPYFNGVKIPNHITEDLAVAILQYDIDRAVEGLGSSWPGFAHLSGARQDACVNMAFQLGVRGFMEFKDLREALSRCNWQKAYAESLGSRWARQTPERAARVAHQFITGEHYAVPVVV